MKQLTNTAVVPFATYKSPFGWDVGGRLTSPKTESGEETLWGAYFDEEKGLIYLSFNKEIPPEVIKHLTSVKKVEQISNFPGINQTRMIYVISSENKIFLRNNKLSSVFVSRIMRELEDIFGSGFEFTITKYHPRPKINRETVK